jgi:hypothetical protein
MTVTAKAPNKTPAKTLLKLEYLRATIEGEARFSEKRAERLTGIASIRRQGMAVAFDEAERALRALIDELESEQ